MKRVLIAEDDKYLANAYKTKLADSECEVALAYDGNEAIEVLKQSPVDLVVLDLLMPKTDGFRVLEVMKKNVAWARIPVMVVTNLSQEEDFKRVKNWGGKIDFIVKTDTSLEDLVEKIKLKLVD